MSFLPGASLCWRPKLVFRSLCWGPLYFFLNLLLQEAAKFLALYFSELPVKKRKEYHIANELMYMHEYLMWHCEMCSKDSFKMILKAKMHLCCVRNMFSAEWPSSLLEYYKVHWLFNDWIEGKSIFINHSFLSRISFNQSCQSRIPSSHCEASFWVHSGSPFIKKQFPTTAEELRFPGPCFLKTVTFHLALRPPPTAGSRW